MKSIWLSLYIYSGKTPQNVLKEFLSDLIKIWDHECKMKLFFFIRYFDSGPHIRFRVKVAQNDQMHLLNDFTKHVYRFNERQESHYDTLQVKIHPYLPEIERYGGKKVLNIIEQHFNLSSKAALSFISIDKADDYSTILATALQLHLVFLKSLNISHNELRLLLLNVYYSWLPRAFNNIESSHINGPGLSKHAYKVFSDSFYKDSKNILRHLRLLLNTHEYDLINPILDNWYHKNLYIMSKVKKILAFETCSNKTKAYNILSDLIHMTNNRVGVINKDESYIAFILLKFFKFF